jgi:hypothetical protein
VSAAQQNAPPAPQQHQQQQHERCSEDALNQQLPQLAVMLDDLQLLLLPAAGTSDTGVLLQLPQLHLQQLPSSVTTVKQRPDCNDVHGEATAGVLHGTHVAAVESDGSTQCAAIHWSELSVSAVQQAADEAPQTSEGGNVSAAMRPAEQQQQQQQQEGSALQLLALELPAVAWLLQTSQYRDASSSQIHHATVTSAGVQSFGQAGAFTGTTSTASAAAVQMQYGAATLRRSSLGGRPGGLQPRPGPAREDFWDAHSSVAGSESFYTPRGSSNSMLLGGRSSTDSMRSAEPAGPQGRVRVDDIIGRAVGSSGGVAPLGNDMMQPSFSSAGYCYGAGSSIIAASWRLDPPGTSPVAATEQWAWLAAGGLGRTLLPAAPHAAPGGDGEESTAAAAAAAVAAAAASGSSLTRRSPPGEMAIAAVCSPGSSSGTAGHQHTPSPPAWLQRSLRGQTTHAGRRTSLNLSNSFNASSALSAAAAAPAAAAAAAASAAQPHNSLVSSHALEDDAAEFFSLDGDSSDADEDGNGSWSWGWTTGALAGTWQPTCPDHHQQQQQQMPAKLLMMDGLGATGCAAQSRWLLLRLLAAGGAGNPAVRITVHNSCSSGDGGGGGGNGGVVADMRAEVVLMGWQLQASCVDWERIMVCALQMAHAATSSPAAAVAHSSAQHAVAGQPRAQQRQRAVLQSQLHGYYGQPQQQLQQSQWGTNASEQLPCQAPLPAPAPSPPRLALVLDMQDIQACLFLPPANASAAGCGEAVAHMHAAEPSNSTDLHTGGGGGSSSSRRGNSDKVQSSSSSYYCPWQDPGGPDSGSPTWAGSGDGGSGCADLASRAVDCAASPPLFAQTLLLQASGRAELKLGAGGVQPDDACSPRQVAGLYAAQLPQLLLSLGALPWDSRHGRPGEGGGFQAASHLPAQSIRPPLSPTQQQQHQQAAADATNLPVLLLKDMQLKAAAQAFAAASLDDPAADNSAHGVGMSGQQQQHQHLQPQPGDAAYAVRIGSISVWVSTARLALLLQLWQQAEQRLPALAAAEGLALATPNTRRGGRTPHGSDSTAAQRSVCCELLVLRGAVLVSTDEPEPRFPASASAAGGVAAVGIDEPPAATVNAARRTGDWTGRQAAAGKPGLLGACSTPLFEVALLPLRVRLCAAAPTAAMARVAGAQRDHNGGGTVARSLKLCLAVSGSVIIDSYCVSKLGWEPVLDMWPFEVGAVFCILPCT